MRFEIRAGGSFLILAGLAGLSGLVFTLGLIAGYEMARQDSANQEVAAVYQLPPAPPAAEPSSAAVAAAPVGAASDQAPAAAASAQPPPVAPPALSSAKSALAPDAAAATSAPGPGRPQAASAPAVVAVARAGEPAEHTPDVAKARAPVRPSRKTSHGGSPLASYAPSTPAAEPAIDDSSNVASAEIPAPAKHGRFSVQIEAAMDRRGADAMVRKLRPLGYLAYIVETEMNGQTWYRVRVGPFATEADAHLAEQRLHDQYSGASATH